MVGGEGGRGAGGGGGAGVEGGKTPSGHCILGMDGQGIATLEPIFVINHVYASRLQPLFW